MINLRLQHSAGFASNCKNSGGSPESIPVTQLKKRLTGPDQRSEARIPSYQLRGNNECGCPTCHRVFSSERAFDLHRVGEYSEGRKCAENLSSVGLELDSRGRWRVPR